MSRRILQLLTVGALATSSLYATTIYTDTTTGELFSKAGEGRVLLGEIGKMSSTPFFSKAASVKLSGKHYLGYRYKSQDSGSAGSFETRRNYLQVKAYLQDDPKSYMRVTLDTFQAKNSGAIDGTWVFRLKYAYLYLNEILPYTGVEIGQAHRPWIDYEQKVGWHYRSISKTFTESKRAGNLTGSTDLGINFQTRTDYFTSDIGVYNGEGYYGKEGGESVSLEYRVTAAVLGNGAKKRKPTKMSYLDISTMGQYNIKNSLNDGKTYSYYGIYAVYNQPRFLIAAQYLNSTNDKSTMKKSGDGYSINATYRLGESKKVAIFGRYGIWSAKDDVTDETYENLDGVVGVSWKQNSNVTWIVNANIYDPKDGKNYSGATKESHTEYMVSAEVKW